VRLVELLAVVDDDVARRPSRLPDWTVGHVLTHLARNADGVRGMVEAAARATVGQMYPGGMEQRSGDIERGAGRPAAELAADVRDACAALDASWPLVTDDVWANGRGATPLGERPLAVFPFTRWREVQLHALDLGLDGFGIADLDPAYVEAELSRQEPAYRERTGVDLPAVVAALDGARRLAWLVGRFAIEGAGDPGRWS
jgi:maleylpyruvate isomerase